MAYFGPCWDILNSELEQHRLVVLIFKNIIGFLSDFIKTQDKTFNNTVLILSNKMVHVFYIVNNLFKLMIN